MSRQKKLKIPCTVSVWPVVLATEPRVFGDRLCATTTKNKKNGSADQIGPANLRAFSAISISVSVGRARVPLQFSSRVFYRSMSVVCGIMPVDLLAAKPRHSAWIERPPSSMWE